MTQFMAVPVPAVPPRPPQLSLIDSAVKPKVTVDQEGVSTAAWDIPGDQLAMLPDELRTELQARKGETWVRGFTYAPENRYQAELRDRCDFSTVDTPALAAPTGLALQDLGAASGTLPAATYTYEITAVNANGETTPSASQALAVALNHAVKLTWAPTAEGGGGEPGGVTYRVYGRVGGSLGLLATVGPFDLDQTPTYTDASATAVGAVPPVSNTTGGPGVYTNLPTITVIPYVIVNEDWCSTWGWSERDYKGRALRLLENAKYAAVEKEFWGGAFAQSKSYPNPYLAQSSTTNAMGQTVDLTPGTVPSVARGQQILQDALQQCGLGGQGMIHVQAQTAPDMLSVRRNGNLLLDIFDNIVVPGVGYPGTAAAGGGAAAGTAVMFATDLVAVRVEEDISVFPDSFAEAVDRGQNGQPNKVSFRAERFAAAYFDAACHFACRVTLKT